MDGICRNIIRDGEGTGILKKDGERLFFNISGSTKYFNKNRSLDFLSDIEKTNNNDSLGFEKIQGSRDPNHLQTGIEIDCYKLTNRCGSGFSSEVWSARVLKEPPGCKLEINSQVAIKFYNQYLLSAPDSVLRIEREFRTASKIRHPNLIKIYEFLLSSSRPNHNFLVMDLAHGVSLNNYVRKSSLTKNQILSVVHQIASALRALHDMSIYHRDIKPNNISIHISDNKVHCTLLDLGIVSIAHEKSITINSRFLGSRHWAPHEQLMGEFDGAKSDLYSFAAVIYGLIEKKEPYELCKTEAAVAREMERNPIRILSDILPKKITDFLNKCLSPSAEERPTSVSELLYFIEK